MASQQEKHCDNKSRLEENEEEQHRQQQSHDIPAMTPQEAQEYRAAAQQKSFDLIRAAEELFAKASQSGSAALNESKEATGQGLGATTTYLAGKGSQATGYAAEKGKQGYEAAKDTAFTAGQMAAELAKQAAVQTKDAGLSTAGYVAEKAKQGYGVAKDAAFTTGEKTAVLGRQAAGSTKDSCFPEETNEAVKKKAEKAKKLTSETAESVKGKTEDAGRKAAEATREKTGEAKKKLGNQTEKSREKMSILSISEEEEESKEPRKRCETGEVDDKGEWIVVKEMEPEVEIAESEGKSKISEAGAIIEAVGKSVIGAAMTAKEKMLGKEPEKGEN